MARAATGLMVARKVQHLVAAHHVVAPAVVRVARHAATSLNLKGML
jgi:hypothetical protein